MRIATSARKHGVHDADVEHVVAHPLAVFVITGSGGDEAEAHVGLDRDAASVLEVLVVAVASDELPAAHADAARATYLRTLP